MVAVLLVDVSSRFSSLLSERRLFRDLVPPIYFPVEGKRMFGNFLQTMTNSGTRNGCGERRRGQEGSMEPMKAGHRSQIETGGRLSDEIKLPGHVARNTPSKRRQFIFEYRFWKALWY